MVNFFSIYIFFCVLSVLDTGMLEDYILIWLFKLYFFYQFSSCRIFYTFVVPRAQLLVNSEEPSCLGETHSSNKFCLFFPSYIYFMFLWWFVMGKTRILYVTTKHFAGLSRDGQSWSLALVRRHLVSRHFCLATLTGFRKPMASQLILVKTGKPAGLVLSVEIIFF